MEKRNMKKKITNYEAPQLTVVEFRMEKGFATSALSVWNAQQRIQTFVDQQMLDQSDLTQDGQLVAGYMDHVDYTNPTSSSGWQFGDGSYF